MASADGGNPEILRLQAELRGLGRERSMLIASLLLVIVLALVDRAGTRVYAIAVWDAARGAFVEQAYLPERAQADQVIGALREKARLAHPYYAAAPEAYDEANPGPRDKVVIRRVRRITPLAAVKGAVDLPVSSAVEALDRLIKIEVDAYGIFDAQDGNRKRLLAVLPSKLMAMQATETRLENVTRKVEEDLRGIGHLVEKPDFLQRVEIELRRWPVEEVMTVDQAVDYLTNGDAKDSWHEIQTGETGIKGIQKVAEKYDAKIEDLQQWNPGRDLTTLAVGDKLIVRRAEPPLTVQTVERRSYNTMAMDRGKRRKMRVTVEIRRHNGVELRNLRKEVGREPAG